MLSLVGSVIMAWDIYICIYIYMSYLIQSMYAFHIGNCTCGLGHILDILGTVLAYRTTARRPEHTLLEHPRPPKYT